MAAKPIWNYIPPALIALNTLLVAENWYLRPQSAGGCVRGPACSHRDDTGSCPRFSRA